MSGTISLTRYQSEYTVTNSGSPMYPLKVLAEGVDMPSEIFVYQLKGNGDPFNQDVFRCVASVFDLYEFPVQSVIQTTDLLQIPYYRSSIATFYCRSAEELEELWQAIKADTSDLVKNFNASERLLAVDSTTITETDISVYNMKQSNQYNIELDYRPAGVATIDGSNVQGITSPDDSSILL